jgi:3',5'-cyclic AMP phosphodiesterase CpdA
VSTGSPAGHGFAPTDAAICERYPDPDACRAALSEDDRAAGYGRPARAVLAHDGYYSFSPAPGLRFVVLDTVTDSCGSEFCSEGSVDDVQFRWLEEQIVAAEGMNQRVLAFSHHTLRTTRFPSDDASEQPLHYGQLVDRRDGQPQNQTGGETLEQLYCRHPVVIAHVSGHEHENYVEDHKCAGDDPPTPGVGRFIHVSTAAHIDWPQQSRMIEVVRNGDATLSLVLTILDHEGPPYPGNEPHGAEQPPKLASIARELTYNDYQASRRARGEPEDRNVIVVMDDPVSG